MKKFAALCALAVVLGCLFLAGGAFAEEKSYVWKVAHIRPAGSEIDKEITWFADEMLKATDGRIDIQVYGANQLGDYTVVQEKIGIGSVLAYWPVYFGGIGLLKEPAEPLNPTSPKNLKVRVPTMKTWEALADAFGYMATPLPFAEFFTAAQTGIVDGIFGGGAENYHVSFQDLMKCYIAANTHFECWPFTINLELYESLSEADRKLLDEKARELEERRWVKAVTDQDHYVDLMEQAGTVVYRPTDEQLKEFARIGREVSWGEFKKVVGDKAYDEIVSTFVLE
ncbi:MAG: Bacterial extracellular solute-binding protein, family 7 [Synergistetes bacterium ADurb.BinA166]|nr:MAG: Bacterial extracellular solute-binding protein, family 7 [Synergistetes bacterium ADurb.BinA166]